MRTIQDWTGKIIGRMNDKPNGDKIAYDRWGRIIGKYQADLDTTFDEYGRILGKGDLTMGLIYQAEEKEKAGK